MDRSSEVVPPPRIAAIGRYDKNKAHWPGKIEDVTAPSVDHLLNDDPEDREQQEGQG